MLKSLIKIKLAAFGTQFSGGAKANTTVKKLGFIAIMLWVLVTFGALFGQTFKGIAPILIEAKLQWLYFVMYGVTTFSTMTICSMFTAKSQLFEARDNDLMLSLPIKPSAILASRMFSIVFFNLVFELMVAVPALLVWTVSAKQSLGIVGILAFVILSLGLLFLSTFIACLIGWLLAMITARVRKKSLMTSVMSIMFLAAYFVIFPRINDAIMSFVANSERAAAILMPVKFFGTAIADGNLLHLLIAAIVTFLPFILFYILLTKSYVRILSTKYAAKKVEYKEQELKSTSKTGAIFKQQLSLFFSSSAYVTNNGIGIVMMIFAAVALFIFKGKLLAALEVVNQLWTGDLLAVVALSACMYLTSLVLITSASISIEAKTLWQLRSLPVKTTDILKAKLNVSNVLGVPACMLLGASVCFNLGIPFDRAIFMVLSLGAFMLFTSSLGLLLNIYIPHFNWQTEMQAVKQGVGMLIAMLIGCILSLLPAIIYYLLMDKLANTNFLLFVFLLMVILYRVINKVLMTKGADRFERL